MKTILFHGDRHQNRHIFVLSAPVAARVDALHVDVWIAPALQWAVVPVLDVNTIFLTEVKNIAINIGMGKIRTCRLH